MHVSVQFSSVTQSCLILYNPMYPSTPGLPVHHQLPEFTQTCPLSQWCHPIISSSIVPFFSCLWSFPISGLFQWVSSLHQVAKILEFQLQHQSFQWTPGLISLRMDWLDLLAVQGTLKSLLQHHSRKALILLCSAFFIVQLSHPYITTGKTIALTRWTFAGKIMSLLFNKPSGLVIAFLPRSKHLLISWWQSPSAVILEPQKIVSLFPLFPHLFAIKWWDQMPWSLFSECWALRNFFTLLFYFHQEAL